MSKNLTKFIILIFGFIFFFSPFMGSIATAQDSGIVYGNTSSKPCPYNARNTLLNAGGLTGSGGASIDGSSPVYSPDVGCTCQINECRLSTARNILGNQNVEGITSDLSFICIPSNTNNSQRLSAGTYAGIDVTPFQDMEYWKSVAGQQGVSAIEEQNKPIYYLDIFSSDPNKSTIPEGSTCRTHPNDPNGVAYWFYPGYFDIMRGVEVNDANSSGQILVGGACSAGTNVLFSNVDLFGNTVGGTQTIFGCLPNSINGFVAFIVRLVTGLAIAITFIIILVNLILIISNSTSPDAVAEYQKKMTSAIFTLIGILLSVTILSIFGLQIIGFGEEGVGGSLFRIFVGG